MRGQIAVDLNARIAPQPSSPIRDADSGGAQWDISGVARFTGMHGWRLTERDTDPAVNLSVEANWRPGERRAEIRKLLVEMPASRLQGIGDLDWAHGFQPQLHIASSTLALGDVLSWYRALRPEVAEDLRADCAFGLDITLGGWPIQIQQGGIVSTGGTLTAKSLPAPLQIGALKASVSRGGIDFAPAAFSFASTPSQAEINETPNSFTMRGSLIPRGDGVSRWPPDWNFSIEGATPRVQDWLVLTSALGQPINSGWTAAGGLAIRMRGVHLAVSPLAPGPAPGIVPWLGTMDFLDLDLSPAYINQPVSLPKAHVEFAPLQRTITLSTAEAFGAVWHGTIVRKYSDKQWTFDLSADQLDAADLDRWLGPRARPGFLARFTGSNSVATPSPVAEAVVARLAARGRLRAGVIDIPPVHIEQFDGEADLAGREIRIRKAQADFFGGKISGALDAQLLPDPSYEFQGRFDRVNLAQLGSAVAFLDSRIGGSASGTLTLSAHGVGRQDLIGSMEGQGTLNGKNAALSGLDLFRAFPGDDLDTPSETFSSVQGTYRIQNKEIDLANFVLDNSRGRLEAEGRIDFSHALNIRVHPSIFQAATAPASASPPGFLLSGTIETPKLVLPSAVPKSLARPNFR